MRAEDGTELNIAEMDDWDIDQAVKFLKGQERQFTDMFGNRYTKSDVAEEVTALLQALEARRTKEQEKIVQKEITDAINIDLDGPDLGERLV